MDNDFAPPAFTQEDRTFDAKCNVFGHDFDPDGECGFCGIEQGADSDDD